MRKFKCISRPTTLSGFGSRLRSFFFVLAGSLFTIGIAQAASTDIYYAVGSFTGSDPATVCLQQAAVIAPGGAPFTIASQAPFSPGSPPRSANCQVTYKQFNNPQVLNIVIQRFGTTCPDGGNIDSVSGQCVNSNKCAALKGTAVPSFRFQSTTDAPVGTIGKNGCGITLGTGICVTRTAPFYDCTFSGTITGDKLDDKPGQSSSDCTGAACTANQPQKQVTDNPCAAIPAGSGFTCSATKSEDDPGKSQCGTANGAYVCVDNPKPTSSNSKSDISQTVTSNSDGSTTTKTTTTTTTTNCKGIGDCATGTTTTVVTGGTNPNGTNKPPSSTCTGPECGGGKVGGGNGNGNGSSGQGDDEEDDPEDDDSVSGDMVCTALVACSGDVIQCAILRQEQQSRCADEKFRDISDGPVNDAKATLATEFAGNDYQPLKAQGDDVQDFSSVIKTDSWLSKSCPVLPSVDIPFQQFKTRLDFNLSGLCDFLTYLGYINVAFALYKAAEIVGKGV